jgi:hypothetical protein
LSRLPSASIPRRYAEEGASISINHMQRTVQQRRFASGRTRQLSRELLPAATRRENQELKTDAPSGHGLAAALGCAL